MVRNTNSLNKSDIAFHELPEHKRHTLLFLMVIVLLAILVTLFIYKAQVANFFDSISKNQSNQKELTDQERQDIIAKLQAQSTTPALTDTERQSISESLSKNSTAEPQTEAERQSVINQLQNVSQ